jgi:hypothetical protein
VCEPHLDLLALTSRLLKVLGASERPGKPTSMAPRSNTPCLESERSANWLRSTSAARCTKRRTENRFTSVPVAMRAAPKPGRELVGLSGGELLRQVELVPENPKARHHEPESYQRDAGANPGEKRSLFRQIVPQVNRWLCFDGRIHFDFIGSSSLSDLNALPGYWVESRDRF